MVVTNKAREIQNKLARIVALAVRGAPRGNTGCDLVYSIVFCFAVFRTTALDEKRKQDARIGQLEEELEEERTQNELLLEKFKRANMQVC